MAGVELPDFSVVADLATAFDGQTGRLDIANERYVSGIGIVQRCEARDRLAVKKSRARFLGLF